MTGHLDIDGTRLECQHIVGSSAGLPTLLLLHEGLGCVGMWKDFPARLSQATGHSVFVYSRRGYGRSDSWLPPWSTRYMHDEALEMLPRVLAAAGLDEVILVGHSDGASIALIYAGGVERSLASAIVLMAPHVFVEDISVESIELAAGAYTGTNLRDKLKRYHGGNVDAAFWGWNKAWLHPDFARWNIEEYLPVIEIPTLLIQGADDQYGTRKQLDAIERQTRGPVTTRVLADCRHSPHIDQTGETLRAIADFLGLLNLSVSM